MNRRLIFTIISLVTIGIIFIAISSLSEASITTGDKFFFIKKQIVWLSIGFTAFFIGTKIKLKWIESKISLFYYGAIFLLLIVLIPKIGNQALGARRWLDIGIIGIQPSEIYKMASIFFFSYLFSQENKRTVKNLLIYLIPGLFLILLEPNFSTIVLVTATVFTIFYLSGGEILPIFTLTLGAIIVSFLLVLISPYRAARLKTLLNPSQSTTTAYHTNQMLLALASGGLTGKGFANSDQKYRYLPKISTDSILAVIGEETGFVGISIVAILFTLLITQIFAASRYAPDVFSTLFAQGLAVLIAFQSLINISATCALIPLTGVPLPLISYGGSSLVTLLFGLGLVQNLLYSSNRETPENHHHSGQPPHASHRVDSSASIRHGHKLANPLHRPHFSFRNPPNTHHYPKAKD